MPMMAITTSSSTRVKPDRKDRERIVPSRNGKEKMNPSQGPAQINAPRKAEGTTPALQYLDL
jgi:hypothetical protein